MHFGASIDSPNFTVTARCDSVDIYCHGKNGGFVGITLNKKEAQELAEMIIALLPPKTEEKGAA